MPGIQVEVATLNPILSSIRFSTSEGNIDLLGFYTLNYLINEYSFIKYIFESMKSDHM